ncbi:MAG: putative colanic acid biosynthesis acetyltransferase [Thermodesulfovibrionales bacterium]
MQPDKLDIAANRRAQKYSAKEITMRVLWSLCSPFFRCSPRPLFGWRRFLLRLFGAKVGRRVHIYNSAIIYMPWNLEIGDWSSIGEYALIYNLGKVTIGKYSTVSHKAHICAGTHDYTDPAMPLLKPPVSIGDQAWVCTDAYVGPGVSMGEGAVAGARAVVVKDVDPWSVVAGNPARVIRKRSFRTQSPSRTEA